MSVRERTGELAVLRALGFTSFSILLYIAAEAVVLAFVGGFAGLLAGAAAIHFALGPAVEQNAGGFIDNFRVSPFVVLSSLVVAPVLGASAALLPALAALRVPTVDALRRVA